MGRSATRWFFILSWVIMIPYVIVIAMNWDDMLVLLRTTYAANRLVFAQLGLVLIAVVILSAVAAALTIARRRRSGPLA